jgi:hypothetical protein
VPAPDDTLLGNTRTLDGKIAELDSLEQEAAGSGNSRFVQYIRTLRGSMIRALQDNVRRGRMDPARDAEDPVIRRMGLSNYLRYLFGMLLDDTVREKRRTQADLEQVDTVLRGPAFADSMALRLRMEIRRDELSEYCMRLNQYEVWLREHMPQTVQVEIDRWARFSEYGISNINFTRIQEIESRIVDISGLVGQLERTYQAKKAELGKRIESLLGDVAQIEKQMQAEMQKRKTEEKERFLNTEYFQAEPKEIPTLKPEREGVPEKEGRP